MQVQLKFQEVQLYLFKMNGISLLTYQVLVVCNGVSSMAGCGVLAPVLTYRPPGHHMRKLVTGGWLVMVATISTVHTGHG